MLSDLEDRRKYVKILLKESSQFRELVGKLCVIVFRGQENPLATLIFSDSLEAMGFHVHHIENFENLLPHEVNEILKPLMEPPVERRVMVLGQGIDDQTSRVVSYLTQRSVEALTIPFYSISRHGLSLFEKEQLHDIPTELYLSLKDYIERAASLARGPGDTSLDHRPSEAPRVYR